MKKRVIAIALGRTGSALTRAAAQATDGVLRFAVQQRWEILNLTAWRLEIPTAVTVNGLLYATNLDAPDELQHLLKDIPSKVEIFQQRRSRPAPCVVSDKEGVGLQAANYYLERGFRHFALAAYTTDEWVPSLRVFKQRIEETGGACQAVQGMHLQDGADLKTVRDAVKEQLQSLHYPLGIFCANDRLAARLCLWCRQEGIAVPEQAAILGCDNDTMTCCSSPVPLSSVDPHYEQIGFEAARLLQRMMDGEAVAEDTVVRVPPREIVTRRSTDIMAVGDVRVAHALRYIWDHYRTNISPDDVAAFCRVPRRSLDRAFKKALDRTVNTEILRQRLAKARDLLEDGNMSSVDIAAQVGFNTPQYFNYQFKKHVGITPKRYREREQNKS